MMLGVEGRQVLINFPWSVDAVADVLMFATIDDGNFVTEFDEEDNTA